MEWLCCWLVAWPWRNNRWSLGFWGKTFSNGRAFVTCPAGSVLGLWRWLLFITFLQPSWCSVYPSFCRPETYGWNLITQSQQTWAWVFVAEAANCPPVSLLLLFHCNIILDFHLGTRPPLPPFLVATKFWPMGCERKWCVQLLNYALKNKSEPCCFSSPFLLVSHLVPCRREGWQRNGMEEAWYPVLDYYLSRISHYKI